MTSKSSSSIISSTETCIERLQSLTTCAYCAMQLRVARILPCHHSCCTVCIEKMISMSPTKDEFLCPVDRKPIKKPPFGVTQFELDERAQELGDIRFKLEESTYLADEAESTAADIDISVESISKGLKDIEHSSVMAQHAVNTYFEDIFRQLKSCEEKLVEQIHSRSQRQVTNLQFEKYRLLETKMFQNQAFNDSTFVDGHSYLAEPFSSNIDSSTPASTLVSNRHTSSSDVSLALMSCHVGHQHIEFKQNELAFENIKKELSHLGQVVCDFDVKVKLHRNLIALEEYPYGMQIGNTCHLNDSSWTVAGPKSVALNQTKSGLREIVIANTDQREFIILDSSFNLKERIPWSTNNNICAVSVYGNHLYAVDSEACQVLVLNRSTGEVLRRFGRPGEGTNELKRPTGVTTDHRGRVIVTDSLNHRVKILSADLSKCVMTLTNDRKKYRECRKFSFPCGVTCDQDDNIYVTDTNNSRIVQFSRDGVFMKEIKPGGGNADPRGIAVASDNKILVTDRQEGKVLLMDDVGKNVTVVSGITDALGHVTRFKQPCAVTVDGTDKIIVADVELNSLFVF